MTERGDAGIEPADARDRAVELDGDDYVINGQKWFTTAADGAAFASRWSITDPRSAAAPAARA
jgi:acyl-CoA dehydrogenase